MKEFYKKVNVKTDNESQEEDVNEENDELKENRKREILQNDVEENIKISQNEIIFPTITNSAFDKKTVSNLRNLLSGKLGEYTAIGTYFYQFVTTTGDLSTQLETFALEEMQYAEQLAKALIAYGVKPVLWNAVQNFWSSKYINYESNPKTFLQNNIRYERIAISAYEKAKTETNNQSLKDLFDIIIQQKNNHIAVFNELLTNY